MGAGQWWTEPWVSIETNLNSGGKIWEGKSNLLFGDRSLTICFHQPPLSSCLNCQSAMEEKALCACLQKVTVITIMNGILHRACKEQQLLHPSCLLFVPAPLRVRPAEVRPKAHLLPCSATTSTSFPCVPAPSCYSSSQICRGEQLSLLSQRAGTKICTSAVGSEP